MVWQEVCCYDENWFYKFIIQIHHVFCELPVYHYYFLRFLVLVILLDERKKIFVVIPAFNKGDDGIVQELNLRNQAEFLDYRKEQNGSISINDIVISHFNELQDGHTYLMSGGFWTAVTNGIQWHQAEDTLLERETTLIARKITYIWRVVPNGFRYTLHRKFFTLCKRLLK